MTLLDTSVPVANSVAVSTPAISSHPTPIKRAFTVAVTSGKGGVGKTNLAVGLATLLAQSHNVVLVDADMGLANANVLCGVVPRQNLAHVVEGQCSLADILTHTAARFRFVPGASGIASMAALTQRQREDLLAQLETLQSTSDIVLFDTGAGIGREVLAFTQNVDHVLLVTTPEPTAMLDAYAVLKVLTRAKISGQISMVVNQAKSLHEAEMVHFNIISVAQQFLQTQVPLLGHVLLDPNVPLAVRQRTGFVRAYPRSPATASLRTVAQGVERLLAAARPEASPSFFHRLFSWWG